MAIGTAAAIGIGLAGVGAGASALSGNAAAKRAAQTSQQNTEANVGLAREIYGQNQQMLNPFMQRGNAAGNQLNALLGLGGGQPMQQTPTQGGWSGPMMDGMMTAENMPMAGMGTPMGAMGGDFAGYVRSNPDLMAEFGRVGGQFGGDKNAYGQFHWNQYGQNEGRALPGAAQQGQAGQTPQQAAESAFDTFRNSTGYQFRLGEGLNAVNSAFSGIGGLQSGAAIKANNQFGQNFASNEFANYANMLGNQQAVGAGSASALAGVGQNFAGTVIGQNNFNAQNQMGAQLGQQNALGNVAGILGGGLFSMGGRR
jgi:hypothetical protein